MVYYNDIDKFSSAWLTKLMESGIVADGKMDERSILDVKPAELEGFDQCHFFSGIGVWQYALRQAGWPDDRPVWTGSCPCQPFSAAGKGAGFDDERHVWPYWFHLIRVYRPRVIFGEQVASKSGLAWFDLVQADLEGEGYTVGATDTCAAGVGAPHIRQRLYWVAESKSERISRGQEDVGEAKSTRAGPVGRMEQDSSRLGRRGRSDGDTGGEGGALQAEGLRGAGTMADPLSAGSGEEGKRGRLPGEVPSERPDIGMQAQERSASGIMANTDGGDTSAEREQRRREHGQQPEDSISFPGPANGFWADAEWLPCKDGKARPVEPGSFPLVNGATNRVGRLRGYGNSLVAPQAIEFVRAYMDVLTNGYDKPDQTRLEL